MQTPHFNPLSISEIALADNSFSMRSTAFLTLVSIQSGTGTSQYEDHEVPFKKGKLYVIPQGNTYLFCSKKAQLLVVECPQEFVDQVRSEADRIETCDNLRKLAYINHNYHNKAGCIFTNTEDETFAMQLVAAIQREYQNKQLDYLIIRQSIAILLNLIARNLIAHDVVELDKNKKEYALMRIISHIQENIRNKEELALAKTAEIAGLSKTYFGEYFKSNMGISYQDYVLDYKLKLVETRLRYSSVRIKEIAFELQFNDESHLTKVFKKHRGLTPSAYRKASLE